jgi:hypothetical protein
MTKLPVPLEHEEAVTFADYLRAKRYRFTHIPQETFTKNWGTKMRNKQEGVTRGIPDYCIIIPMEARPKICFVELKRRKGSKISTEQQQWIDALHLCGIEAAICRGASEAIGFVESVANPKR